jgi:NDP-sugar pyrophosphorylase family protein
MRKTVIIGTGAVAAELTSYISDNNKFVDEELKIDLLGYIDYEYNLETYWKKYKLQRPILGDIDTYNFDQQVDVLIGVSNINYRNNLITKIENRGGQIGHFFHHTAIIPDGADLGRGNIIYPYCIIGPNSKIGSLNLITSYSCVSHDCILGNGNVLSSAIIAGRVNVKDNNFFGIRSSVIPNISIGSFNTIQAGMIVDKSIENETTVFYKYKEQILAIPK